MPVDRRLFIRNLLVGAGIFTIFPQELIASSQCDVLHPITPPDMKLKGVCHNCGMKRPMWARTWHTYSLDGENLEVCSMHCLAEASFNSGRPPEAVQVALYLEPQKSISAEQAYYVIGSKARGTMTMNSKLAFSSKQQAEAFVNECGGTSGRFSDAYDAAMTTIAKENKMIGSNRISKGKIVEPVDNKDICPVCGMYSARYPKNKCQIQTADGKVIHFCATQCLFEFIKNPDKYNAPQLKSKFIWVVDFENGQWIYAKNAYYVLGTDVRGPMGKEAFPFVNLENAKKFASAHAGKILRFDSVTIAQLMS
jgi:copper chaperone NosL